MGFTVSVSPRDRKLPQSARCLQFGQSSMCWEETVGPVSFLSYAVVERSYPLGHSQPEAVKNEPELVTSWVNGKRLPLILNWSLAL